ncbi:MAG TPA: hypothetical protein VG456_10785 [Candidatus Sulfopaludibacter sp.]|jgi:hypothetical protein|nr:hypothetical protein [Candidatus Sulfopaludibacter sp.]
MILRSQIVAAARGWLDTPFRHQGRWKDRRGGIDCAGLPLMVAIELGIKDRDGNTPTPDMFGNYPPQPVGHAAQVFEQCARLLFAKEIADRLPGDVLAIRLPREACHTAMIGEIDMGSERFLSLIHAYSPAGKVIEHILDDAWLRRVAGCFSYAGVDERTKLTVDS